MGARLFRFVSVLNTRSAGWLWWTPSEHGQAVAAQPRVLGSHTKQNTSQSPYFHPTWPRNSYP